MVNVTDIITSVVMAIIVVAVSIYLFAIYCHRTFCLSQLTSKESATHLFSKF